MRRGHRAELPRAQHTRRDAEGRLRDGDQFWLPNPLSVSGGSAPVVEIMFGDGMWMIASPADVDLY